MTARKSSRARRRRGFSLIELLVVLGIIVILLAVLIPVVGKVRRGARQTKCLANLRSVGQALVIYQNENKGWAFPVKTDAFGVIGLGLNVPPHERWPMKVLPVTAAPSPPPYDALGYDMERMNEPQYDPAAYTAPVLTCPDDDEPRMAHTYVLNNHLADDEIRAGKTVKGISSSEVIVAGEKKSRSHDYYMEWGDYDRVVDPLKHGAATGSNYLYLDGHAAPALPAEARRGIDPWDPTGLLAVFLDDTVGNLHAGTDVPDTSPSATNATSGNATMRGSPAAGNDLPDRRQEQRPWRALFTWLREAARPRATETLIAVRVSPATGG